MEVRHYHRFSDLVRALRKRHELSQRALAQRLGVSPGYVGQWELRLSQPSPEMAEKLCQLFGVSDVAYVQRLAFAERAPEFIRDALLSQPVDEQGQVSLSPLERRILDAARRLPPEKLERLAERVDGWVEGALEAER